MRLLAVWFVVFLGAVPRVSGADLLGHWKFDETSGSVVRDVLGARDGQLSATGAAFVGGGISGNALQVDRTQNGYAQLPAIPGLVTNDFTVLVWGKVAPGDTTSDSFIVVSHESWSANGFGLFFNASASLGATSKAGCFYNGGNNSGASTTSVNDGNWHQIALVCSQGSQVSLYVDGSPAEATFSTGGPAADRSPPIMVGGLYGQTAVGLPIGYFTGWVDDLQIYGNALTPAEIDALFQAPGRNLQDLLKPVRITPNGGDFVASAQVTLASAVPGTVIRYTLDGSDPVFTSTLYAAPFTIQQSLTLKTRLFLNEFPVSEIISATFTKVPPITFHPPGGLFTNAVAVTLTNRLGVGTVHYTTDGNDPTTISAPAMGPLTLTNSLTLKARVFVNGFPASEVVSTAFSRVYAVDDGVPNSWREQYFGPDYLTDPRVGAQEDPDRDGWINLYEYQSGSHPLDPASFPLLVVGIRAVPKVSWNSIPGLTYQVLRKSDVNATNWTVVLPSYTAEGTNSFHVDPDAPATAVYLIERIP